MLGQSGLLTLLGMSVVFSFLIIMILSMKLLHGIVHVFKLDKEDVKSAKSGKPVQSAPAAAAAPQVSAAPDQKAVIAAIAAAIHEKESI